VAATGFGVALVIFLLLAVSQVDAQTPASHDVVFLIDNSPSVRTGEGAPDGQPTDPAQVRLRLAHFMVNVLGLDSTSARQRVGAISFARSTRVLMPLTLVRDWSKADFAAIREVDQGSGTDFAVALNAASEILFPPGASDCSPGIHRCDIVIVTDGFFDNVRRDYPAVNTALQNLHSRGVLVHLLTFAAGHQDVWQEFVTNALISTYQPNVTLTPPSQVYGTALHSLGAEAVLAGLTPAEVVGERVITLTIPPFRTWTSYQILPDSPMTVTFLRAGQVVTPVVVGTEYTFFWPQAGNWSVLLQGEGLAYYRQAGEGVANLSLYLREPGDVLALGDDVVVLAGVTAGGVPVTDLTSFTITAMISSATSITGPLKLEPDGRVALFTTTVLSPWFKSGVHTLTLVAESDVPGVAVRPVMQQFDMIALPTLKMMVMPTGLIRSGQSVYVTVTVGNWQPTYVPELWHYELGGISQMHPMLTHRGGGLFTAVVTSTPRQAEPFVLAARLSTLGTPEGLHLGTLYSDPWLVAYHPPSKLSPLWYLLGGFLLGGLVFTIPWITRSLGRTLEGRRVIRLHDDRKKLLGEEFNRELSGVMGRAVTGLSAISKREWRRFEELAQGNPMYQVAIVLADKSPVAAARLAAQLVAKVPDEYQWLTGTVAGIILRDVIKDHPETSQEILNELERSRVPDSVIGFVRGQ
jgi:hypothetical protein